MEDTGGLPFHLLRKDRLAGLYNVGPRVLHRDITKVALSTDLSRYHSIDCSCVLSKFLGGGKPGILTFKVGFSYPTGS